MRLAHLAAPLAAALSCLALAAPAGAAVSWRVTKTADTGDGVCNADCSLREAVAVAGSGDTIVIPASASPYDVTISALLIDKPLTIAGAGARSTLLRGDSNNRVIRLNLSGIVTIGGVTISGGTGRNNNFGGGISVEAGGLNLNDAAVSGNGAVGPSSGINAGGGGINVDSGASVTLTRVLVSANSASTLPSGNFSFGGGILNAGSLTVVDSTITGNTVQSPNTFRARGGGIEQGGAGTPSTVIRNSTIAGNSAGPSSGFGGSLEVNGSGVMTLRNSIITGGRAAFGANCESEGAGSFASQGGNIKDTPETGFGPDACALGAGDRPDTNPRLSALGDFGGPTDTFALTAGSPAIDFAGACGIAGDQRGVARPQGPACDSGAFEVRTPAARASASSPSAAVGQPVSFDGSASTGDALSFAWNFGDGATATGPATTHAFSAPGSHSVTLTVTDVRGLVASASVVVSVPDTVRPVVSALGLRPTSFAAARSGPSARSAAKRRKAGTLVSYKLSEPAKARFTVRRARAGRRSGKRCAAPRRGNRHARACTRYVSVKGSFSRSGTAGANRFRFSGRLRHRRLAPGRYRLVEVATDSAGNRSRPKQHAFRIVRRG